MRKNGRVKFFDREKGYGFITPDGGGQDVFVHVSAVQSAGIPYLQEGMTLSFETRNDPKGRGQQALVLQLLSVN